MESFFYSRNGVAVPVNERIRPLPISVFEFYGRLTGRHVLLAERTYERITSYAQFFVGPQAMPVTYEVALGRESLKACAGSRDERSHFSLSGLPLAPSGTPGIISNLIAHSDVGRRSAFRTMRQ